MLTKDDKNFIEIILKPIQVELTLVKIHLNEINGSVQKHQELLQTIKETEAYNKAHNANVEDKVNRTKIRVEKIEDNLSEYNMAKKYPKVFVIGIWVAGLAMILLTLHSFGIF